jgi:hypothetical protein
VTGLKPHEISKRLNNDLRGYWQETGDMPVRASFMANARQLHKTWPEVVTVDRNNLTYDAYMQMAVCRLPSEVRDVFKKLMKIRVEC